MLEYIKRLFRSNCKYIQLRIRPNDYDQALHDHNFQEIRDWCYENLTDDQFKWEFHDQFTMDGGILTPTYVTLKNVSEEDIMFLKLKYQL